MSGIETVAGVLERSPWGKRRGLVVRPGVPAIASPMWQAVEWSNWIVTSEEGPKTLFLKMLEPDLLGLIDATAAHAGAVAGAAAGVAPLVEFYLPEDRTIGFAYLPSPWRSAWLDDLQKPDVVAGAIAAKKAFRQSASLARVWDVFAEADSWAARAETSGTALPSDISAILDAVREGGKAIAAAGKDLAPCHNDGQASNLLLGPEGQVWLCD
ncbi:MAG TPA: hypothetical protein VL752_09460, partial [Acidisoma sp.]|uniref:phosphotransferase family protein n=1 Tax=Acidisoma sp. TaxID=1872115 RepID=UPI002C9BF878|nr:hypothetical protein [Acidisoma sp.]